MDLSRVMFFSNTEYEKVLDSGTATKTVGGASFPATRVTVYDFSALGLTRPPMVLCLVKQAASSLWKSPGGGIYVDGQVPYIEVTNTLIKAYGYSSSASYNFKFWILDSSMKAD